MVDFRKSTLQRKDMSSQVKIKFVRLHRWGLPKGFSVFHSKGSSLGELPEQVNGAKIPLWPNEYEQAGFGHGPFGTGRFGWGLGQVDGGGFGSGLFGVGEFGYCNPVTEWTSPKKWTDGLHTFGVQLYKKSGPAGQPITETTIFIASTPEDPAAMKFLEMADGQCRFLILD
jgi:hypothetical protein